MVVGLGTPSILLSTLLVLERLQLFCPLFFSVPWIVIGLTRILTFLHLWSLVLDLLPLPFLSSLLPSSGFCFFTFETESLALALRALPGDCHLRCEWSPPVILCRFPEKEGCPGAFQSRLTGSHASPTYASHWCQT